MVLCKRVLQLGAITILISALLCCGNFFVKPTQDIEPIYYNSATELANTIRRGEITSVELLNIYLDRIQGYNSDINAVVALDAEAARLRATEADKALTQGQVWGPLHGAPMTVKDVFENNFFLVKSSITSCLKLCPYQSGLLPDRERYKRNGLTFLNSMMYCLLL